MTNNADLPLEIIAEVYEVVSNAESPINSEDIFNKCQIGSRKEVAQALKHLAFEQFAILRDKNKCYYPSTQPVDSGHEVEHVEVTKEQYIAEAGMIQHDYEPEFKLPEPLKMALDEIATALNPPAITSKFEPKLKVAVLDQLSRFMHPEISDVLQAVREDIEIFHKVGDHE